MLAVAVAALTGCSDDEPASPSTQATTTTPTTPAVDVPEGVTLTDPGDTLQIGKAASVVYRADENRRSVVTVTVKKIRKGRMKDFKHFSLDRKSRSSTPYYVNTVVRNDGPGGLSRAAVPLYGLDSSDTYFPPTQLVGEFDRCVGGALPAKFAPGDKATRCFVLLVPKGAKLRSVQVRTEDLDEPVSWPYRPSS